MWKDLNDEYAIDRNLIFEKQLSSMDGFGELALINKNNVWTGTV